MPALVDERGHVSDLELETDYFEQIGVAKQHQNARLRFYEMRILVSLADRGDFHAITADLFGERCQVGERRYNLQRFVSGEEITAEQYGRCRHDHQSAFHRISLERVRTVRTD